MWVPGKTDPVEPGLALVLGLNPEKLQTELVQGVANLRQGKAVLLYMEY